MPEVHQSLREIPKSVIEMLESLTNQFQMALAIIKESMPGLISGVVLVQ